MDIKLIIENSKDLNVLYVEDDDNLRNSTFKLLKNFFKVVDVAQDGKAGLEMYEAYFQKELECYDIVISDIEMPNMSGLEMCQNIKNICNEQVVIFITAFQETQYLKSAIEIGANGFLSKPINMEQLKKILYSTSQIVADRKLVKKHYKQIADTNMLSINLRDASSYDSAKNILEDLETNQEKISHLWLESNLVRERLDRHNIDSEFFRTHYGIKVIEYFLGVVKEESEIGNCPVVFVMLDFFKNKDLLLEEIFMICVEFKNTITSYLLSRYTFNKELFKDISLILDANFEGVIVNYLHKKGCVQREKILSIIHDKETQIEQESQKSETIDVSYSEYVLENDIYELHDLEEEIDTLAIMATSPTNSSPQSCINLGSSIHRYGVILSHYPIFLELGNSIIKLGINLSQNAQILYSDREKMSNISVLIEGFVNDLIVWRKEIFEHNIEDYKFLNNSISSNVDTIIMFIEYDETEENNEEDGEIDFF